jgi:signal recognition particle subunit SRP54
VGEKVDALEDFHPDRMASRILQQGDIVSLVETAQESFDADEAKRLEKKVRKEGMDLQDFLTAMKQMERLGPLEGVLKLLPGVNTKVLKQVKQMDPRRLRHLEAIVLSMTPDERKNPGLLNGSRRARVAKGSGRPINEVNRLLEQFREMQKMMKKVSSVQGGGRVRPGMFGGLM